MKTTLQYVMQLALILMHNLFLFGFWQTGNVTCDLNIHLIFSCDFETVLFLLLNCQGPSWLVSPVGVVWEIWATFLKKKKKRHRNVKEAKKEHKSSTVMEAMEWLHITSNASHSRYIFDICFLQVILGHTSHLTRWQETAAGLGDVAPAQTAPARSSNTSFRCSWGSEGNRQSWCPWGHHQAG